LDFLKLGNTAALDATFYSAEDIWHMVDVQRIYLLVQLTFTAALVLLVLTLIVNRPKGRDHFHYIAKAAALPLVVIVIYSLLNFDSAFILFHKLLFPHNTFWLLDPATSNLIKFLPQELFRELFVLWLISSPLVYLALNRFMLLLDAAPKHAKPVEL
jgi:integral membrane protein (TIGR01906 family)